MQYKKESSLKREWISQRISIQNQTVPNKIIRTSLNFERFWKVISMEIFSGDLRHWKTKTIHFFDGLKKPLHYVLDLTVSLEVIAWFQFLLPTLTTIPLKKPKWQTQANKQPGRLVLFT